MIGIYKITNLINQKSYIGQSVHIERRFAEHCFPSKTSVISQAIQKYGKENFLFEVIEECEKSELDKKEQYWIKTLNTLIPNGYNVAEDSESNHTTYVYFEKEIILNIIKDLQDNVLTLTEIAEKYNINKSNITRINNGDTHKQDNLSYPLRNTNWHKIEKKYCLDCGIEISSTAIRCNSCEGKNRRIPLNQMPITREELKNLIRKNSFISIGQRYGVSDNAIRKWCVKYNLPKTKKEINSYSDEEWNLI